MRRQGLVHAAMEREIERERENCLKSLKSFQFGCNDFINFKHFLFFTSREDYDNTPPHMNT